MPIEIHFDALLRICDLILIGLSSFKTMERGTMAFHANPLCPHAHCSYCILFIGRIEMAFDFSTAKNHNSLQ